jgi:hypothetical protein
VGCLGELARLLRESYDMVVAKLPKNMRDTIAQTLDSSKKKASCDEVRRKKAPAQIPPKKEKTAAVAF